MSQLTDSKVHRLSYSQLLRLCRRRCLHLDGYTRVAEELGRRVALRLAYLSMPEIENAIPTLSGIEKERLECELARRKKDMNRLLKEYAHQ